MNCDPNALAKASKCFDCLAPETLEEVQTYLMCAWVNGLAPVVGNFLITDAGQFIITDAGDNLIWH